MKISELIERLSMLPPDALVVLSGDGEGNKFSPAADLAVGHYRTETTWSGEFATMGGESWESDNAVCLWPTN